MVAIAVIFYLLIAIPTLNASNATTEKAISKRSYVCPPNFVRLSHRCYYFSKEKATWQAAYFQCRDLRSNLAIIKTANQDKLIRKTLSKNTLAPLERWIGGVYDWEQMQWKWAASGKPLSYQGFQHISKENKENLRWHCIMVDPTLNYRWNTRSCIEEKHFICHTKLKIVTNKDKKKLMRQYKVNKLNEIPVPEIPIYDPYSLKNSNNSIISNYTKRQPISLNFEINNALNPEFALRPKQQEIKRRKLKKNRRNKKKGKILQIKQKQSNGILSQNGLGPDPNVVKYENSSFRRRRNRVKEDELEAGKDKDTPIEHIKWKTYRQDTRLPNPLYPQPIVEEFNYVKDS